MKRLFLLCSILFYIGCEKSARSLENTVAEALDYYIRSSSQVVLEREVRKEEYEEEVEKGYKLHTNTQTFYLFEHTKLVQNLYIQDEIERDGSVYKQYYCGRVELDIQESDELLEIFKGYCRETGLRDEGLTGNILWF